MARYPSAFALLLLAGSAASARTGGAPDQAGGGPQGPVIAGSNQPVPKDAPREPGIRNVPATTGRANLPPSAPPFAIAEIGRFDSPFAVAVLPGGDLLVTEKAGVLRLRRASGAVLAVSGVPKVAAGGQGGLLDVAAAPDFTASRRVYFSYAEPRPNGGSALALAEATLRPQGQLDAFRVLWRAGSDGPGGQFGARIAFAPDGRSLFLTSGERQRFSPAQDPKQLLGKVVHLTLDGRAAPGNPFAREGGWRAGIWTSGHRNPYGLVFSPDARLWEVEMGPRGGDELNLLQPGRNYGWPVVSNGDNYSGQPIPDHPSRPDFAAPKAWWNPSISPGGMIYYSGAMFPALKGTLLIAALSGQGVAQVRPQGDRATPVAFWDFGTRIRDIAQAPDGAILLLEDGEKGSGGRLLRLTPKR